MFSKYQGWLRHNFKIARIRYATILSFVVLVVLFGVVQASGPMRPQPPHGPGGGHGPMGYGQGMWGKMPHYWYPAVPVPTIKIIAVVQDEGVTFETMNFPADEEFTVTMGKMYTRGVGGIVVGSFNSGDGSSTQQSFRIPPELNGDYKISIRAQTDHMYPYFAFNWFYNNTTDTPLTTTLQSSDTAAAETTAESAAETTAESAAETTAESAEEATGGAAEEAPQLVGQVWKWEEMTDPINGTVAVNNPENYLIEFLPEGGINVQADCNIGNGTYTAGEDGTLSISVVAMTLALCEPDSLSDQFVNNLSAAAGYFFMDGDLYIDMFADAGTMKFAPHNIEAADAAGGEGEVGTGGSEASTEAEATTEAEASTEAEATTEAEVATEEGAADDTSLTGAVWQWSEFTDPTQGTSTVENPEVYTAEFLDDGSVNVQADCNSGRGNYTTDGSSITISDLAMTRALCAEESLSDQYVQYLTSAAIYFFEDANLFLDLPADSGTMMFVAAEESTASFTRGASFKMALQDGDEDPVPSFTVCTVVKNETVTIVTEDFPVGKEFRVQMGVMPEPMAMPYYHGPMPYTDPYANPMSYDQQPMGQNMGPGMDQNMGPGMGQNMGPSMGQNMGPSMDQNMGPSMGQNMGLNMDQNMGPSMGQNMGPSMDQNMGPSMGQNMGPSMDQNMGQSMGLNMDQNMGPSMGQNMGLNMDQNMGPSMGQNMGPSMGPPPMGQPDMKGMWGEPMGEQKIWIPYYDAGTFDSGNGGSLDLTLEIPAELFGTYRITVLLRTDDAAPYYAYNWFYNNDAEVCDN